MCPKLRNPAPPTADQPNTGARDAPPVTGADIKATAEVTAAAPPYIPQPLHNTGYQPELFEEHPCFPVYQKYLQQHDFFEDEFDGEDDDEGDMFWGMVEDAVAKHIPLHICG